MHKIFAIFFILEISKFLKKYYFSLCQNFYKKSFKLIKTIIITIQLICYFNSIRIIMKTSARNEIKGTITEIIKGQINSEVVLSVSDNVTLKSVITNDSVDEMELVVGETIYAIIKAPLVIVAKDKPTKISTRNIIETKVIEVKKGIVNGELKLAMGDQTLTAVITEESIEDLEFNVGDTVYALIKATFIILAK